MSPSPKTNYGECGAFKIGTSGQKAFTLVELIIVMGVIAVLLALSVPSSVSIAPVRKTALYEVKGFLEYARSEAISRDREVYVAFANHLVPGDEAPYRAYAAFVAVEEEKDGLIADQKIQQLSEWRTLPTGAVFVTGLEFSTVEGASLRTILDSSFRRNFPHRGNGRTTEIELPFLLFSPGGRVLVPSFFESNYLHVGIAEGFFDRSSSNLPIVTSRIHSPDDDNVFAHAECLRLNHYTGTARAITD